MTSLECRINHYGEVGDLLDVRVEMEFLSEVALKSDSAIIWHRGEEVSHDIQVVVIGQSGFGKSTLLNRLIGIDAFESSDIEACTRVLQAADFKLETTHRLEHISFCDLPGIGENKAIDEEYIELYRRVLHVSHAIIYVVRADQRDHAIDKWAFERLFSGTSDRSKLIIAMNQIDKLPILVGEEAKSSFVVSDALSLMIESKLASLARILGVARSQIIPISATRDYGMDVLTERIGRVLMNYLV